MVESIKELRIICQKSKDAPKSDQGFFRTKMWTPICMYTTKLLLYTNITANQVTFIMILSGFLAAFFFALGNYWCSLIGAFVLVFSYVLDGVDGEVARYRKTLSNIGVFLDLIAHFTNIAVSFIGIAIGLYTLKPSLTTVILGLSATVFMAGILDIQPLKSHVIFMKLVESSKTRGLNSKKTSFKNKTEKRQKESIFKKIFRSIINPFYDHLLIMCIILFAAIFNKLYWVLVFYGLTTPIIWTIKLIHEYRTGTNAYNFLFNQYKK